MGLLTPDFRRTMPAAKNASSIEPSSISLANINIDVAAVLIANVMYIRTNCEQ
jgi:hypothetical protein